MTRDVHRVPGRVRFKVPGIREDKTLIGGLSQALTTYDGVDRVEVRPASSSLIVHYHPKRVDCQMLARFINDRLPVAAEHGADETASNGTASKSLAATFPAGTKADDFIVSPVRHMAVAFGHAAFKVALEQAVRGGLNSLVRATLGRI